MRRVVRHLSAFRRRGAKLIVPQGVSDPVFSLADTIRWYREVHQQNGGHADIFVRLFAIPGTGYCQGGPSTDGYDAFAALADWVEGSKAPDRIDAKANPASAWPRRTRPHCAFPKVARYEGSGSLDETANLTRPERTRLSVASTAVCANWGALHAEIAHRNAPPVPMWP